MAGAARAAVLLALFGCGGRAAAGGPGEAEDGQGGAASDPPGSAGTGGSSSQPVPSGVINVGGVRLPACQPGSSRSSAGSECLYVFQGRCYAESIAACACACAGLARTTCITSGFLDPDQPETVSCSPN